MSNPYELAGRLRKANALETALLLAWERLPDSDTEGRSLADVLEGPDAEALWSAAVDAAGVKPPSQTTKSLVISGLRRRDEIMADPFAGIGPEAYGSVRR